MKYRTNITATSNKHTPEHARARYRRATLRRSRIDNGVVRVAFVKVLPPAATLPACRECGGYVLPTETVCAGCWAAKLTPPSPPWEEGA